jgi:hypothetical protein
VQLPFPDARICVKNRGVLQAAPGLHTTRRRAIAATFHCTRYKATASGITKAAEYLFPSGHDRIIALPGALGFLGIVTSLENDRVVSVERWCGTIKLQESPLRGAGLAYDVSLDMWIDRGRP